MKFRVDDGGARLDLFLSARFSHVSRSLIMKYLKEGHARLNGGRARPGLFVQTGDEIELPGWDDAIERIRGGRAEGVPVVAPRRATRQAVSVLYEDDVLLVVDKPPGLVMHPGKGHEDEGLDRILRERFGASVRLVHRIDRDTSGVVVAARGHPESARRLALDFKAGAADKSYLALARGVIDPASGVIDGPLLDTKAEGSRVYVDPHGKPARTDYETLEAFRAFSWLRVRTRTGRRHQIRAHLAHIGHPLAVDRVYSKRRRLRLGDLRPDLKVSWKNPVVLARQPLHAEAITIRHPVSGEDMTFHAPLPSDLNAALEALRTDGG